MLTTLAEALKLNKTGNHQGAQREGAGEQPQQQGAQGGTRAEPKETHNHTKVHNTDKPFNKESNKGKPNAEIKNKTAKSKGSIKVLATKSFIL